MALTLSNTSVPLSPFIALNKNHRLRSRVLVSGLVKINGASCVHMKNTNGGKKKGKNVSEELKPLWDDGYGTQTVKDFATIAMDLIKSDGGPPRWFCPVACGMPIKDSPVLLYLPGMDGTGAGLVVHEKALGKVFHVQCLHIPVHDRTTFEGLIQIVEETVNIEHDLSPSKPIYFLGDSFGGTLALAVAARNPTVDLVLILANPGDFVKMAMVNIDGQNHSHLSAIGKFLTNLTEELPLLSVITTIIPKDTLNWRIKLLESAVANANSRIHAITAEVLVLASGKDNLLPSKDEAQRLSGLLKHCNVRVFEENGHAILMESGVNVLSVIRDTQMYRRSPKFDIYKDFLPPSMTELKSLPMESWRYHRYMSAAMFSTMENGKIVRGLEGIPDKGPVLLVGNHMLWGIDAFSLVLGFLKEKKVMLHSLAHPENFRLGDEYQYIIRPYTDSIKLLGGTPVSGRNLFKLLARKSHTLLYPGGVRKAFHRKGEDYKLFWPDKQEFVRMAVKFGATIIPFGVVGEDDILELIIDYNDMKRIPFLDHMMNEFNEGRTNVRDGMTGEIAKQPLHTPIFLPKLPGRLYFLFGKPIQTKGMKKMLNDNDHLQELYIQIRCDVERNVAYLLTKREGDPYRSIFSRLVWQMNNGDLDQTPSFEP